MRLSAFLYVLKQGLKNIFRNKLFSLASVATIMTCIFLFGTVYSIVTNMNHMVMEAEEGVAITVFFEKDISNSDIKRIGSDIKQIAYVDEVTYISAEEAWTGFKRKYFAENEELANGFEDDNPLANSANYQVTMTDVSHQKDVTESILGIEGVRRVNSSESLANTLTGFNSLLAVFSIAVIGLLLVISVFLISNTIAVGVSVRKEEIAIMKLMGAKNSFVRAPFLIEGIILGAVGAAVPLVIIYFLYSSITEAVLLKYGVLANFLKFMPVADIFKSLLPLSLFMGVLVGFLGSYISIRKHLQV